MAEGRQGFLIKEDTFGSVTVSDEVIAVIAALTTLEVEGVASMAGNISKDIISRLGMKNLSRGVHIEREDGLIYVYVSLNIAYGYSIPAVSADVQKKVKSEISNMTGLQIAEVNVRIADVDVKTE